MFSGGIEMKHWRKMGRYVKLGRVNDKGTTPTSFRSSRPEVFFKKGVLRNFAELTRKHLYRGSFLIKLLPSACNFIKTESLTQVFSCEFCEIYNKTFCYRTSPVAVSDH